MSRWRRLSFASVRSGPLKASNSPAPQGTAFSCSEANGSELNKIQRWRKIMRSETGAGFAQRPIGDIATSLPGATGVFRKHRLDFCCGGDQRLRDAAAQRGADLAAIEKELVALDLEAESDVPTESAALIDYILYRYHETHRRQLPELLKLALKVESVHE